MKKIMFILLPLILIVGCTKSVDESTLIEKDGLMYQSDSEVPYSGEVFGFYSSGGKLYSGLYENGFLVGEYTFFNEDGSVKGIINSDLLVKKDEVFLSKDDFNPYGGPVVSVNERDIVVYEGVLKNGTEEGHWKYYDGWSGRIIEDGIYKSGIKNGLWTSFDRGEKEQETHYLNGKLDGLRTLYGWEGRKVEEESFKNGNLDGRRISWYNNGNKKEEENYTNGRMDGFYIYWYENGQKQITGTYKNGQLVGNYHFNSKDGSIKEPINFHQLLVKNDKLYESLSPDIPYTGECYSLYTSGEKESDGTVIDGVTDGLWTVWYKNGQKKSEGHYKNRGKNGLWTYWYKNGQKNLEVSFENDLREGLFISWFENGQIDREGSLVEGEQEGLWTFWYETGQKSSNGHWNSGNRNGLFTYWYENGQKKEERNWSDNKETGLWIQWDENGRKTKESTYQDGEVVSTKDF